MDIPLQNIDRADIDLSQYTFISTFQNGSRERMMFLGKEDQTAVLYHTDCADHLTAKPIRLDERHRHPGIILDDVEVIWLVSCWNAFLKNGETVEETTRTITELVVTG